MHASQNMLLTIWDSETEDTFNYLDLENNWNALDQHDHSAGKGVQIGTGGIAPNAITTGLIAPQAVQNGNIAPNAVGTSNIQTNAITNALLAPGSVHGTAIANAAITATMLDPTLIPLGQVGMWWRPPGSAATPGGFWEIMDGRPWNTISNAWGLTTGNIPDMRGAFAYGADITGSHAPGIGNTGGSAYVNLDHLHNVNPHSHTIPSHTHGINTDGNHLHYWLGGLQMWMRQSAFTPNGVSFQSQNGHWYSNNYYAMYVKNSQSNPNWSGFVPGSNVLTYQTTDGEAEMDPAGQHSHGGATTASGTLTSSSDGTLTDLRLGSTNVIPPYNALLFIMRCR